MSQKENRTFPNASPGFALIIALSLMALMVLLTVSVSTMVQVELSSSTHRKNEDIARMNALYGMQVALGELQQLTGPDQRATAPATTVFPNSSTTPSMLQLHGDYAENRFGYSTVLTPDGRDAYDAAIKTWWENKNPHWVGVWDSTRDQGVSDRDQLPKWLVSGNERFNINLADVYPNGYLTPDMDQATLDSLYGSENFVYVVDEGSAMDLVESTSGYDGRVRVLKQEVVDAQGLQSGNFAYWVGDESLKANFAVRDPFYDETNRSSRDYRNRLLTPQRVGWENITGFEIVGSEVDGAPSPNDPRLEMLSSSSQISLMDADGNLVDPVRENFHNLTAYSKSLLTDPVNGGLKKDLTVYFEEGQGATNGYISDNNPIPNPNDADPFGYANDLRLGNHNAGFPGSDANIPTWGQLKEWYDTEGTETQAIEVNEDFAPVVTYVRMFIGFSYDFLAADAHITMHFLPTIVVWNPYDAPLEETSYELDISYPMIFEHFMVATPVELIDSPHGGSGAVMYYNSLGQPTTKDDPDATEKYFVHELTYLLSSDGDVVDDSLENDSDNYYFGQPMYTFSPWGGNNSTTDITLRFKAKFEPGENLIFSVNGGSAKADLNESEGKIYIDVENLFLDDKPDSATIEVFKFVKSPGINGNNMKWISGLNGLQHHYGIELRKSSGETLYEAEKFGYMQSQYTQTNIINGRSSSLILSPNKYDKVDRLANNIGDWRKLHDSKTALRNDVGSTTDNKNKKSNDMDSPVFALGQAYLLPFGTIYTDPFDHHRYVDQTFRHMATHNMNARYPSVHPLVDEDRGIFSQNNDDGFGKFKYGMGDSIRTWNNTAHVGLPWDDNLSEYNIESDVFNGSSLISYRFPLPESTEVAGASDLPMRLVRRPDSELVSLGQLQQVNLSPFLWQPAFPIGNAEASPYVDRELMAGIENHHIYTSTSSGLRTVPNDSENMMIDMSYLLNDSLWDHYFLSTIPQTGSLTIDDTPDWPNSRHRVSDPNVSEDELRDFDTAAAHLYNVGALNVNSTSVEAWKSLLSGFRDLQIQGESEYNPDDTVPISRTLTPLDDPISFTFSEDGTNGDDFGAVDSLRDYYQLLAGFRYLDDAMIQTLAERIVDEVRLRGPFLSMSDFVNRRLDAPDRSGGDAWLSARTSKGNGREDYLLGHIDTSYDPMVGISGINGALQRAINLSGINGGVNYPQDSETNAELSTRAIDRAYGLWPQLPTAYQATGDFYNIDSSLHYYLDMEHISGTPAGEFGQLMSHLPGFVTQGDLLSMIGPALTTRGDTFIIRSYGDSVNQLTGDVEFQAWLEAVVQRMVDPIEDTDGDFEPDIGATNDGRRYRIIALRWLTDDEV
ncbi:hypothetical protein [Cerasicoccus frondis]|uniref:hypothetical protein n=1 Tax=Cerasicoccus frondis TaxID=490090 RepID=UPI00285285C1|nr:hypothetical protein [Cerasicoccus frondis]